MNKQGPKGIEWTHVFGPGTGYTWNPVAGCRHRCRWEMPGGETAVCYAEVVAEGLAASAYPDGFAAHYWHPARLEAPLRLKAPAGIFLDSMSDLMGAWVPEDQVRAVLDVVRRTPQHVYFLLTKNAPRLLKFNGEYPPNLWVGVSMPPDSFMGRELAPHQQDRYVYRALDVQAQLDVPVRWWSFEPLSWNVGNIVGDYADLPFEWAVIGAASNGRNLYQPKPHYVERLLGLLDAAAIPVFFKGNLDWQPHREDFPEVGR